MAAYLHSLFTFYDIASPSHIKWAKSLTEGGALWTPSCLWLSLCPGHHFTETIFNLYLSLPKLSLSLAACCGSDVLLTSENCTVMYSLNFGHVWLCAVSRAHFLKKPLSLGITVARMYRCQREYVEGSLMPCTFNKTTTEGLLCGFTTSVINSESPILHQYGSKEIKALPLGVISRFEFSPCSLSSLQICAFLKKSAFPFVWFCVCVCVSKSVSVPMSVCPYMCPYLWICVSALFLLSLLLNFPIRITWGRSGVLYRIHSWSLTRDLR